MQPPPGADQAPVEILKSECFLMTLRTGTLFGTIAALTSLTVLSALAGPVKPGAGVGEWAQWRGPDRTGVSRETGLLKSWPEGGPRLAWKATGCGVGYSTPSVAGGRVFGMGNRDGSEMVWTLDAQTGKEGWKAPIGPARPAARGDGPRSTPTVDGNRVYALGVGGDLACLDAGTGKPVWKKSLVTDFGGRVPKWGYSESPLVDGEKLIVTPGSAGHTLVALNKNTGQVIWSAQVPQGDSAHYSSVIAADVDGQRQYIQFLSSGLVGVSAKDGKFLWRYDKPANGTANCSTPIFRDNHVFAASAYGTGGGLAKLAASPSGATATEVYFTRSMQNHHGGMVLVGDYLYGFDNANLTCLNFKTGQVMWFNRSVGKGSVTAADGHLYCRGERGGAVALVEATPKGYVEKGRFMQPDQSGQFTWPHPVVAGGRLYLRDQDVLLCYDVKGQ
jgi:outer membrane protein assembly factor BamB